MEIADYLRVARRRVAILIAVPLIAAAVAAGYVLLSPATYSATATVSTNALVGGASSPFTGSQGDSRFVAAFAATATGPAVLTTAAKDLQLSVGDLRSGLSINQKGLSSDMSVKFTSTHKGDILPALQAVVQETLTTMFVSQVELTDQQVRDARKSLDSSNKALVDFGNRYDVADPTLLYQAQLTRLNWLLQRQATLEASGKAADAAAMDPSIASVRAELVQFNSILPLYDTLSASQQAAVNALSAAQDAHRVAQAQLGAAESQGGVFTGQVQQVSRTGTLIRTLIPVVGLGVFLAVVAVVILELLTSSKRTPRGSHTSIPVVPEASGAKSSKLVKGN